MRLTQQMKRVKEQQELSYFVTPWKSKGIIYWWKVKTGKSLKIWNNMIHEFTLSDDVIDRVEQIAKQEGGMKYLEFNDQQNN